MVATATSTAPEVAVRAASQRPYERKDGGVGRPSFANAAFPTANRTALAEKCGCTMGHICKIFHGRVEPSLELARKMAQELGLTVEQFGLALDRQRHKQVVIISKRKRSKGKKGKVRKR